MAKKVNNTKPIKCRNTDCGCTLDKNEIKRVYGQNSVVYQANFCSAKCYTEFVTKEKNMLTLNQLKAMPEGTVFATGIVKNNPEGIFVTTDYPDREIRWGAKRGNIHDWAIYYFWADMPLYYVIDSGDKLRDNKLIKQLVPCDDEAYNWYRF